MGKAVYPDDDNYDPNSPTAQPLTNQLIKTSDSIENSGGGEDSSLELNKKDSTIENSGGTAKSDNSLEFKKSSNLLENTGERTEDNSSKNKSKGLGLDHTTMQYLTQIGTTAANFNFVPQRKPSKSNVFIDTIRKNPALENLKQNVKEQSAASRARTPKTSDPTLNMLGAMATSQNNFDRQQSIAQQEAQDIDRQRQQQYQQRLEADQVRIDELNRDIAIDNQEALAKDKAKDQLRASIANTTMRYADAKKLEKEDQRKLAENLFISEQNQQNQESINELSNEKTKLISFNVELNNVLQKVQTNMLTPVEGNEEIQKIVDSYNKLYPKDTATASNIISKLTEKSTDLGSQMKTLRQQSNKVALDIRARGASQQGYQYGPTSNQYGSVNNRITGAQFDPNNPVSMKKGGTLYKKFKRYKNNYKK